MRRVFIVISDRRRQGNPIVVEAVMHRFARKLLVTSMMGCSIACAHEAEIVFVAPTNFAMPLAEFKNGTLRSGLLKDIGDAIAERLSLRPRYVSSPSKRIGLMLSAGEADCVCYVAPRRLEGEFDWSSPFLISEIVLVARADAPVVHSLVELANLPVGTVIGDRYPEIELPLGTHFVRDDAPSVDSMFRKLAASRSMYLIADQAEALYQMNKGKGGWLRSEFKIASLATRCAFSPKSRVPFSVANSAIESLITDGSVKRILAQYR
jgi:polar amino acid transport system substrate-binding protein